jgi:hypothetical protein
VSRWYVLLVCPHVQGRCHLSISGSRLFSDSCLIKAVCVCSKYMFGCIACGFMWRTLPPLDVHC